LRIVYTLLPQVIAFSLLLGVSAAVSAEIYKWVDEDGKVHFGDKPFGTADAEAAEKIEVKDAYQPAERSEEEIERARQEQASRWMDEQAERREEEEKLSAERAERKKKKTEECARLQKRIDNFSGLQIIDGRRTRHVLLDQEGNSYTTAEQNERVAELQEVADSLGCP
jgi:Domain of unknown function (DUF4124)